MHLSRVEKLIVAFGFAAAGLGVLTLAQSVALWVGGGFLVLALITTVSAFFGNAKRKKSASEECENLVGEIRGWLDQGGTPQTSEFYHRRFKGRIARLKERLAAEGAQTFLLLDILGNEPPDPSKFKRWVEDVCSELRTVSTRLSEPVVPGFSSSDEFLVRHRFRQEKPHDRVPK